MMLNTIAVTLNSITKNREHYQSHNLQPQYKLFIVTNQLAVDYCTYTISSKYNVLELNKNNSAARISLLSRHFYVNDT